MKEKGREGDNLQYGLRAVSCFSRHHVIRTSNRRLFYLRQSPTKYDAEDTHRDSEGFKQDLYALTIKQWPRRILPYSHAGLSTN